MSFFEAISAAYLFVRPIQGGRIYFNSLIQYLGGRPDSSIASSKHVVKPKQVIQISWLNRI